MVGWFQDKHTDNVKLDIKVKSVLYSGKSKYQKIDILDTYEFGKMFVLDGIIMLSEKDERFYHEMIVHVSMFSHKSPRDILVVGGGDGGAIRELFKHKISSIDLVEIDEKVIELSKLHFPELSAELCSDRVNINIEPGEEFIRHVKNNYDVIIIDSTDPSTIAKHLYENRFYSDCFRALRSDGLMVVQIGSPFYTPDTTGSIFKRLEQIFPIVKLFVGYIPTYSNGFHSFAFCSKKYDPIKDFQKQRYEKLGKDLVYYNEKVHKSSFSLPNYVKNLLNGG